ncbi:hypothetical protein NE237_032670 [Protea cynaroides]|uniref:Uncharacterized protein n=1 Tax=Protea cynaroides TaxID=273540 RepID=A0A9Q0L3G3_9MAGN|nr:hypothetical protein NE237_032670 [Protea cynaroides]
MEALLKPVSLTNSLRKYSPHERGYLTRDSLCFTARRRLPVRYPHDIRRKWNVKKSLKLSASVGNEGYIEKLPRKKYMLDNKGLSSKHLDGYPSHILKKLEAFYHFCRPYSLVGTEVVILSVAFLPIGSIADLSPKFFIGLLQIMVLQALNHIYIVGINQLFDVEIDKINKQYLPLASGEFSTRDIVAISFLICVLSIGIVFMSKSPALLGFIVVNFIYGTGYSANLPFLRWKRHPLLAISSTVLVWAFGVHIFSFIHIQKYVLGRPNLITKSIIFQTMMMCLYTLSGVILKDIPDTDGDKENGIDTLSVRFGEERAFAIGLNVIIATLGLGMVVGASSSFWFGKIIAVLGHLALALVYWQRSRQTDPKNKSSAQSFYLLVWKLLPVANFLTHFVR